jgi:hypothetical protein
VLSPTWSRREARPPRQRRILGLVILAPALLSAGSSSASGLSPLLADAPPGLVSLAFQAGAMTGVDPNVLLARRQGGDRLGPGAARPA